MARCRSCCANEKENRKRKRQDDDSTKPVKGIKVANVEKKAKLESGFDGSLDGGFGDFGFDGDGVNDVKAAGEGVGSVLAKQLEENGYPPHGRFLVPIGEEQFVHGINEYQQWGSAQGRRVALQQILGLQLSAVQAKYAVHLAHVCYGGTARAGEFGGGREEVETAVYRKEAKPQHPTAHFFQT